jgi:hypothetical protein
MLRVLAIAFVMVACGKHEPAARHDEESCKPLVITVNGKPLPITQTLARSSELNGVRLQEVCAFSEGHPTCENMVDNTAVGRAVCAFVVGPGHTGKGVRANLGYKFGADVKLVGSPPTAVGDAVKICADVSYTPGAGDFKDMPVTIVGLFEGNYCGEIKR